MMAFMANSVLYMIELLHRDVWKNDVEMWVLVTDLPKRWQTLALSLGSSQR